MPEQSGPLVLALSIPGSGDLQVTASDLAGKLAQFSGGSAELEHALAEAVARLVREVGAADTEREIALEYHCEAGQATVTARCGSRTSEVRLSLES